MPVGVILFDFAPDFDFAGLTVRWETIALAATIVLVIGLAALIAGRPPAGSSGVLPVSSEPVSPVIQSDPGAGGRQAFMRRDARPHGVDLLIVAVSALPGAVIGGRIGYVVVHLDYYARHASAVVDPGQGSLELGLATVGGTLTALIVAGALGAPIGRWLDVAAGPVLLGLALGKLAMALGADGQGLPTDSPWATAYAGAGPWGSLAPQVPSHPAQLYEGGLALVAALVVLALFATRRFQPVDGRAFFAALGVWALVRLGVAFTWRDPMIVGPLRAGQLIALAIAAASLVLWLRTARQVNRPAADAEP